MKSNIFKSLTNIFTLNTDSDIPKRRYNDVNKNTIIITNENISALLSEMHALAILQKSIYNDYTKESEFLKFTLRHEFNILSDELFVLFNIIYSDSNEALKIFKKILRYNEIDFVITCNKEMLSFMDDKTASSVLQINSDLMKAAKPASIDKNYEIIKKLLEHKSLTLATVALSCMKNYPRNLYQNISYDRFCKSNNIHVVELAHKIKNSTNTCSIYEKMAYLHQVPLFSSIDYKQLYNLSLFTKVANFSSDHIIIKQGEPGKSIYMITSGEVEIIKDDKVVNVLEDGDYFGEIAIIADIQRTATVKTISDCTTLQLSTSVFKDLIYDNREISIDVMKVITNRLIDNN